MRPSIAFAAVATLLFLIASVFLFPMFACACGSSPATVCLSNVKNQSLGLILYVGDHDDRLPSRDAWMDGTLPYVKTEEILHDPELSKGAYGYAFNGALSGGKPPKDPERLPMVYDSVNPTKNASDLVASLPSPGRHHGRNNVAYADGHVKLVPDHLR